ncbi:hypothetical protein M670_03490 [Schinkia azotoformans MEV2011]|uniref:PD-(D/E)XK nuclease family transposase n=2 Tax=Schinkia azotoformans TaxID=1454 RepID=A0A072NHS1_SCHAZ|nr:hypothetical protein [Schinkia azotoformans]KEF37244.1 hypothetical protein M670_03490 [Schinkia azotoformans MEV2011]MEC1773286.1 hypothetical protein [Schinkia azotoformans]
MRIEENKELPWLMMFSAADYRKKKANIELLSELEEWAMDRELVREALIEWETLSANKENRVIYGARAKELRDLLSNLEGERREGKYEIALKMLEDDLEPTIISKYTGLSEEEIRKQRNRN